MAKKAANFLRVILTLQAQDEGQPLPQLRYVLHLIQVAAQCSLWLLPVLDYLCFKEIISCDTIGAVFIIIIARVNNLHIGQIFKNRQPLQVFSFVNTCTCHLNSEAVSEIDSKTLYSGLDWILCKRGLTSVFLLECFTVTTIHGKF